MIAKKFWPLKGMYTSKTFIETGTPGTNYSETFDL